MALYAFDGTWNDEKDTGVYGENTNVVEFARAYNGPRQIVQKGATEEGATVQDDFFAGGVGTRHGFLGKVVGGAFGVGGRTRIREAKQVVAQNFAAGDEVIDVVGFSRGAALALQFANVLEGETYANRSGQKVKPQVRFLGLWDVVAAFGIPMDLGPIHFQRINLGYKLKLAEHVKYCFHAVAIDEKRDAFRVTRIDDGYQVWFRGVHSDVGGGNQNSKLSNIALAWMLRKAQAAGLPVDGKLADQLVSDKAAAIQPARSRHAREFRQIRDNDRIHYTVDPRQVPECQNPSEKCPRETEVDEKGRILTTAQLKEEAERARQAER